MLQRRFAPGFLVPAILLMVAALFTSCQQSTPQPIKIGFIGGLSGRFSALGIDGRDGALIAIEQANAAGGIDGRPLKLVVEDDRQDADSARSALTALYNQKAAAVIGPMTSSMAMAIEPLIDRYRLLTVGPTISTNELNGKDDYLLRNYPPSDFQARRLADYIVNQRKLGSLSVIYDLNNRAHCESWLASLTHYLQELGGRIVATETFDSSKRESIFQHASHLLATPSEGVVILAGGLDTALISQQLKKLGYTGDLFASEWSFTNDLLQMGGGAVEGMSIVHTFNPQSESRTYLKFKADFVKRFAREPSFAAVHAYDAANLILVGLQADPDPTRLKTTLLQIQEFSGLQNRFILSRFGDAERELFLTTVKDGKFSPIE